MGDYDSEDKDTGILVHEFECPLNPADLNELHLIFQETDHDIAVKGLHLLCWDYIP